MSAEAFEAVGIKMGQAGATLLEEKYSKHLVHLKSEAHVPSRWLLWKMIKDSLPKEHFDNILFLGSY